MYKVKVRNHKQGSLSETGQTTKSRFSILLKKDDHYENAMPMVKCRDYFNDVLYVQYSEDRELDEIYGFHWTYSAQLTEQIKSGTVLMLFNHGDNYGNYKALHIMEDSLGFKHTTINEAEVDASEEGEYKFPHYKVLEIDARWFANAAMLSLYTQVFRMQSYAGDTMFEIASSISEGTDLDFCEMFKDNDKMLFLLQNWEKILGIGQAHSVEDSEYDEDGCCSDSAVEQVHDGGGILSLYRGILKTSAIHAEPAVRTWVEKFNELYNKQAEAA